MKGKSESEFVRVLGCFLFIYNDLFDNTCFIKGLGKTFKVRLLSRLVYSSFKKSHNWIRLFFLNNKFCIANFVVNLFNHIHDICLQITQLYFSWAKYCEHNAGRSKDVSVD